MAAASTDAEVKGQAAPLGPSGEVMVLQGDYGEGGGQVLRNGVAMAALTGQKIRIINIRAGRSKPGLRPQHLTGLQLVHEIVGGQLKDAAVNSTDVSFFPGAGKDQSSNAELRLEAATGTSGSVALLIQVSMPVLLFTPRPTCIILKGGTNAAHAPLIDYTTGVFLPMFQKLFFPSPQLQQHMPQIHILRRGFFPQGGGHVEFKVQCPLSRAAGDRTLRAFDLTRRGDLVRITGVSLVSGKLPDHISHRVAQSATEYLRQKFANVPIDVVARHVPPNECRFPGVAVQLIAETTTGCLLGGSALGERGVSSEVVGRTAAESLAEDLEAGGCVDRWLQDQLIVFMALAEGTSRMLTGPLTLHTTTAMHWATQLLGAGFSVSSGAANTHIIECQGVAYRSRFSSFKAT